MIKSLQVDSRIKGCDIWRSVQNLQPPFHPFFLPNMGDLIGCSARILSMEKETT